MHIQLGIVARRQLSDCGLTDKAIRYRIRPDGPWQIVLPGVYSDRLGKLSDRQRAVAAGVQRRKVSIWQPDAWWPDRGVAVEVDSRAWHLSPADSERTMARHDRMTAEGILVLRFPPVELRRSRPEIAKRITATLAISRGPLPHIVTRPAV